MTEEKLDALRQADTNLRDALRMDEVELPLMPGDLNERLMQRMAAERKKPRRTVWPWIAAACVAGVMMIWLTPPKTDTPTDVVTKNKPAVVEQPAVNNNKVEEPQLAKVKTEKASRRTPRVKKKRIIPISPTPQATEVRNDLAAVQEKEVSTPLPSGEGQGGGAVLTLTEHDIPITRPENYKYTPEELALMKKQADEAYLKWVELELEIAKHNLEQTAQK